QALAAPFGIEVVNNGAPSGVIPDVQPDHGETVIEVINKILGQQQALAYDDPHGRLVIGGIGSTRAHTALVLGENILSCDTEKSIRGRFSVYQVAGQRAGNDDDFGEATTTALRARTEDAFIARYRPMYIRQTGQATGAGCIARADFEARQRAARTDETTYVVQGWRQGNGTLWQPNQRMIVFDPVCGFDNTELLVSEVTFTQDQNGTLTEIRVGPPDAYLPEPEAPGARKKKKARVQEDPF
ncbi:baseplate protein, partial [Escherichia coli]